jgi:ABC-type phosphate/phosphonate transport system ATPase subunit
MSAKQDHKLALSFLEEVIDIAKRVWIEVRSETPVESAHHNTDQQTRSLNTPVTQPFLSVGLIGDVANGKSTLVRAMTGKRTQSSSSTE